MNLNVKLIKSQYTFLVEHFDDLEFAFLAGEGTGKSFAGAMWVVRRVLELGERLFVGSQQWSTTQGVQFQAIIDILDMAKLKENKDYTYDRKKLELRFPNGGMIKGCCSTAKKSIEGYTKFNGCWLDECWNWDEEVKNYVMGRCRNTYDKNGNLTDARFRYTGTPPIAPVGWYYNWLCTHAGKYVQASTEESIGKYNAPSYLERCIEKWGGKDAPMTKIMVYGQLPDSNSDLSIFRREHSPVEIPVSMGIDVSAGNGGDEAFFTITNGINILEEYSMSEYTQKELVAKAIQLSDKWSVKQRRVDATGGYAIWLIEALNDYGYPTTGINFGAKADDNSSYANIRAEMYFNLAKRWNDAWGSRYQQERYATAFITNKSGKLQLIGKEEIKKVIGHSPDGLDSLALAIYQTEDKPIDENQLAFALSLFDC